MYSLIIILLVIGVIYWFSRSKENLMVYDFPETDYNTPVVESTKKGEYVPFTVNSRASDIYVQDLESGFIPYDQLDTSIPYTRWPYLGYPSFYNSYHAYNWPFNYGYPYNFYGGFKRR